MNSCGTDKKSSQDDQDLLLTDSTKTDSNSVIKIYSDQAPEWLKQLPEQEGYVYAAGEGISSRLSIAEDKALFKAQKKLANEMNRLMQQARSSAPGGAQSDEPEGKDLITDISGFNIVKQQRKEVGGKWYVFVLLEKEIN
jgi:hypothetical protein